MAFFAVTNALGISAQRWLYMQNRFNVETAERAIGKELAKIARVTEDAGA